MRIEKIAIIHRVLDAVRGAVALKWAMALLVAAALGLGAGVAQAQQQISNTDIAVLEERMRSMQAESRRENEALLRYMQSEFKLLREERRRELAELENRLTQWMMNFVFAVVGLVMLILPFYILLLRRVLPGLFAPPYYPPQKPESGAAGARAPRKAGA